MPKKKRKAAAPKAAKKATPAPQFKAGERVRVLSGDYGQAHGEVLSVAGKKALVQLGNVPEPQEFDVANLCHGGPNDRVG